MASTTQSFFSYPTSQQHQSYEYNDDGDYSDYDDSDYENEIEYSLQQQDKLERYINGGSANGGGGSSSKSSKSTSVSNNNSTVKSSTKSNKKSSPSTSPSSNNTVLSGNHIKSVLKALDEKEKEEQEKLEEQEKRKSNATVEKSKLTSFEKDEILKRETENTKKERLPSAEEVYNRIKWDPLLNTQLDNFTILYEDRFDGLISASFKDFEFGVVPLHRIQSYKYKDTVIYSRKERLYNFDIVYN